MSNQTHAQAVEAGLAALHTAGRRVKIHDAQMVVKLPKAVKALVQEYGAGRNESEATVVRQALAEFFERRGFGSGR